MGKIFYHGTFSHKPPHEYGGAFHVGTERAAQDRLAEAEQVGGMATIHAYEISDDAPMARGRWADPIYRFKGVPKVVPESPKKKIYPYINAVEDSGSLSYAIPAGFVGEHVKHLGPQFQELRGYDGQMIANAITTMVGGKNVET